MSLLQRLNARFKTNDDTGFGNVSGNGGRFVNRDGSFNLRRTGVPFRARFSVFQSMLSMPAWKFAVVMIASYLLINLFFALVYLLIGVDQFQGVIGTTPWEEFKELYFFSTSTFTTVGYGRVNPVGGWSNLVAAVEAFSGFISFAIIAGLMYGRFSRPKAHISFSDNALVAPYRDGTALMFRLVSLKDNHTLTNAEIRVNLAMLEGDEHKSYKFYSLELERTRVDTLMMNWTVVHPLDENSPLFQMTASQMEEADLEIFVQIRGYDDVYNTTVTQRTSFTFEEIVFDAKFDPMYYESPDGMTTVVQLDRLSDYHQYVSKKTPGESATAQNKES